MQTSISNEGLMQEFWSLADTARTETEYVADAKLIRLAGAPFETLQRIFIQYRYFTIFYITDLALLVAKLPFGELRSLLADFLNDELGNGDSAGSHARLYDGFLTSIGLGQDELDSCPNAANMVLLKELQERVSSHSSAYAIGLRGMGGECLCQVYLSAMHSHFTKNPEIQAMRERIEWTFWDIHTGDVDIAHREKLKQAIGEFVSKRPSELRELVRGYKDAKWIFDRFWENIYAEHFAESQPPASGIAGARAGSFPSNHC
jgi:Iron-containing redox enzyme